MSPDAAGIAAIVGGKLTGNPDAVIVGGRADSRICREGDLYVALPGEKTDGILFVANAWETGAVAALVDASGNVPEPPEGKALISVSDPLAALQKLARHLRGEVADLRVVGITGSNGKTTTKEILAAILREWKGNAVLSTEGNYNSDIGLPLTLLGLNPSHEIAVLEMGMNRIGEMALLAEIARPEVAVITNIGSAHVGMLGSRMALAAEKRAIFNEATSDSTAVVAWDEPWKDFLVKEYPGRIVEFGRWNADGWDSYENRGLEGFDVVRNGKKIRFSLPGSHNLRNAMAAVAAAAVLGAPEEAVLNGLAAVRSSFGRSEVVNGPVTVIRDCYNANPESLEAAIDLLKTIRTEGRRVLVLGELLELGEETDDALRRAGGAAAAAAPDAIFLYGDGMQSAKDAVIAAGFDGELRDFGRMEELQSVLAEYLVPGDIVLLKGSRAGALERLDKVLAEVGAG